MSDETTTEMPEVPDWMDDAPPFDDDWLPPDDSEPWPQAVESAIDMAAILGIERAEALQPDGTPTLSELGNARRMVAMHGDDLRHCGALPGSGWLLWDGSRWCPDTTGQVMRWIKRLPEVLRAEATGLERQAKAAREDADEGRAVALLERAKARRGWAQRCESARTMTASLGLLQTESTVPVMVQDLDADSWLLGTPGTTIDLRSGQPRTPERADLMTRQTGVAWDSEAECPVWEGFMSDIMGGDQEMVDYLQRAVGYSLVGTTVEQVLLVCHGTGANGKSTFLETLRNIVGDYGRNVPADSLVGRREGTIPNDLAMLQGARFVTAAETAENKAMDEALVKALTGGEPVTARYLNREFFEFLPQFTIWLATNHKPRVKGTDHGIWRRIHLVPFRVTITPEKMDRDLGRKLKAESAGILRWAIDGLMEWQRIGLSPPAAVLDATRDYRGEQDVVAEFLDQCCVLDETATEAAAALYSAFSEWTRESGEYTRSSRWLGSQLKSRGLEQVRSNSARLWRGVRITEEAKGKPSKGSW